MTSRCSFVTFWCVQEISGWAKEDKEHDDSIFFCKNAPSDPSKEKKGRKGNNYHAVA